MVVDSISVWCLGKNVVHINWSVCSSDMSTIKHVKNIFEQRVRGIIWAPRNLQALNLVLQEESKSQGVCEASASPKLPQMGDTLVTEGILIFET